MSAYVFTSLARADIFDVWSYIAEENQDAADHVEQAIYDACAFIAEAPLTWPFPHGPYKSFASFLDVNPLS